MNYLLDALLHGDELEVRAQRRQLIVARRLLELSVALGSVEFHPFGGSPAALATAMATSLMLTLWCVFVRVY